MSHSKNQIVSVWKDLEAMLTGKIFYRGGKALSRKSRNGVSSQADIYSDGLILLSLCWYDLISIPEVGCTRFLKPWLTYVSTMDIIDLVSCLKVADDLLLQSVALDDYDYNRFKHDLRQQSALCGPLWGPLKGMFAAWFDYRDQEAFLRLHNCLAFITRLNLPDLTDLEEEAYAAYLDGEEHIQTEGFTSEEHVLIQSWFPTAHATYHLFDLWYPKHGNGAVADIRPKKRKASIEEKYLKIGTDARLKYLDVRLDGKDSVPVARDCLQSRTARLVFVPKSISKLRAICAEPAGLIWYQQGFRHSILEYICKRTHSLSRRINLNDQSLNRDLAWEGSLDGKYATIDLSNASDSISWSLVSSWFRSTGLYKPAFLTRSTHCELPDKKVIALKKSSPSGSALCFPLECIVFAAIVESAICEMGGRAHDSNYRVYGDDIIVEAKYASAVIQRLQLNGFKVNTSKSFVAVSTHNFRESCGGEYLDGIDVTPVRISRKFSGYNHLDVANASQIEGLVDMCNTCYTRLPSVRRRILVAFMKLPDFLQPLFDDSGEKGIMSSAPSNHHLKTRLDSLFYNKEGMLTADYQSVVVYHGTSCTEVSRRRVDETIRLYEWLRSTALRTELKEPCVVSISPRTRAWWGEGRTIL